MTPTAPPPRQEFGITHTSTQLRTVVVVDNLPLLCLNMPRSQSSGNSMRKSRLHKTNEFVDIDVEGEARGRIVLFES